ncbi:hypothetical protein MBRA1_001788 [Malassezia brasiliensis]|uniref:Uncharacterized protein n=1 Tax=Malassezia brasiliensis TaxID=1821822 RepID=A0AAF0DUP9_9BASI|nr:hypothetical protein MBRA1_001788 [Malassezia brasiliensis]
MSSDACGITSTLQNELDAEDRELVRFENAETYFAKQSDFLTAEVQQSENAGPMLEELVQENDVQDGRPVYWEVSYILLLWLSLVALIPFSLGESNTKDAPFDQMEGIARYFVTRPGKERDAASVLLGKLYCRAYARFTRAL